ncbi:MbtH family protein [Roseateles amylovorans]|uniref:MbtH family NRPS accessory protein n=1 Tax=Roseateles amylovorans TaxID=2978473 RepID=A0ABY6ATW2_9BURK|nr:MbtH family NRPS accessory protein [Roseateles amylovorans]UXH76225.1 MbtH family NRPS accessory protein [Roseateles amylovorans]
MSTSCFDREDDTFIVLVNHEDQYSIWPHWKAVPGGWSVVPDIRGDKKTVLDFVDRTWTDMRPKSLRDWMAQQPQPAQPEQQPAPSPSAPSHTAP